MKTILRISLMLNLALLASLSFFLLNQREQAATPLPVLSKTRPLVQTTVPHSAVRTEMKPAPFRWSQLETAKSYRIYIANLRAIGCPEATIEDIVRGDADRVFSWERRQLSLDGSGTGPWSRARELQLVASLLGARTPEETATSTQSTEPTDSADNGGKVAQSSVPSPGAMTRSPSYPLFLQNVNWSALGFTPDQQAAISQVRQQFQNETANLYQNASGVVSQNPDTASPNSNTSNPDSGGSTALTQWQKALQNAHEQLRNSLGAQGYMAYEQQQYFSWFQPQVTAAAASGSHLTINPVAFH